MNLDISRYACVNAGTIKLKTGGKVTSAHVGRVIKQALEMDPVLYLVFLGLGAYRLRLGGGGGLSLLQAVLSVRQPALELVGALTGLLPQLQRGLLATEALLQLPAQRLISTVHIGHGYLQLRQV